MVHQILGGIDENELVYGVKARTLTGYYTAYDTTFILDNCGDANGQEWNNIKWLMRQLVHHLVNFNSDGPSLRFVNSIETVERSKDEQAFTDAADRVVPSGTSIISKYLKLLIDDHNERCARAMASDPATVVDIKPLNIIVITDGDFDEEGEDIVNLIRPSLKEAERYPAIDGITRRVGIQFAQVFNDAKATEALLKLVNLLSNPDNVLDTVQFLGGKVGWDLLYRIMLGAIHPAIWEYTHSLHPPSDDNPEKAYPGALNSNQYALRVPVGQDAYITCQANSENIQQILVTTYPGPTLTRVAEGTGLGVDMPFNGKYSVWIPGGVWAVLSFFAFDGGAFQPSRVKLLSHVDYAAYTIGSTEGELAAADDTFKSSIATVKFA